MRFAFRWELPPPKQPRESWPRVIVGGLVLVVSLAVIALALALWGAVTQKKWWQAFCSTICERKFTEAITNRSGATKSAASEILSTSTI